MPAEHTPTSNRHARNRREMHSRNHTNLLMQYGCKICMLLLLKEYQQEIIQPSSTVCWSSLPGSYCTCPTQPGSHEHKLCLQTSNPRLSASYWTRQWVDPDKCRRTELELLQSTETDFTSSSVPQTGCWEERPLCLFPSATRPPPLLLLSLLSSCSRPAFPPSLHVCTAWCSSSPLSVMLSVITTQLVMPRFTLYNLSLSL